MEKIVKLHEKYKTQQLQQNVNNILEAYSYELFQTDDGVDPTRIYLVDEEAIKNLLLLQVRHDKQFAKTQIGKRDKSKFGFHKFYKLLNPDIAAYHYKISFAKRWKQVSDRQKVYDRLEEEFEVWKNSFLKHGTAKLNATLMDQELYDSQKENMYKKIEEAKQHLQFIKQSPELIRDIRISSRDRSKEYATIYFITLEKKRLKIHLDTKRPNILWYNPKERLSLDQFMKVATHAFGDVYYIREKS